MISLRIVVKNNKTTYISPMQLRGALQCNITYIMIKPKGKLDLNQLYGIRIVHGISRLSLPLTMLKKVGNNTYEAIKVGTGIIAVASKLDNITCELEKNNKSIDVLEMRCYVDLFDFFQ